MCNIARAVIARAVIARVVIARVVPVAGCRQVSKIADLGVVVARLIGHDAH
ncbi:hypothetical protein HC031_01865 [Planosporangium thailandense]|uniref:Uncharacterized protein n=1 Tax=Planosporangium thailandense TaxID=765197 RepID=A0ABX0XR56_9ACTN|nr:hypothetical protein [Planosporangium thailandense]NJC68476.1 hypothetical protein [Planosporangium thailandense]